LYGFTARGEEMYSKKEIIQCNYFALTLVLHLYKPSRPQITYISGFIYYPRKGSEQIGISFHGPLRFYGVKPL